MRLKIFIFASCVVGFAVLAIIPQSSLPSALDFWDKAQHILAFSVLAFTGCLVFPNQLKLVYGGLFLYGVAIEVAQKYFTSTHSAHASDLLADGLGLALGVCIYWIVCWAMRPTNSKPLPPD
jgi:VanZ family protein